MAAPPATSGPSPVEPMVVAAALSRGFITVDQLGEARRLREGLVAAGRPADLLQVIAARFLNPEQREALRRVYFEALAGRGVTSAAATEESTQLLDPPSIIAPAPVEAQGEPDDGPTRRLGDASALVAPAPSPVSLVPPARDSARAAGPAFGESPVSADSLGARPAERTHAAQAAPRETRQPDGAPRLGDTLAAGAPNAPAESIEGYAVERELGRGGMGVVYAATRRATGEACALKVLLAGKGASEEDVQRFQLEAKAAQRLDHPNIVRVIDSGRDPKGHWFMAMELVDGESLEARVRRDGPLEEREAGRVILAMARALEAAHEQRVLHRDLKPHNVLMGADGTPKLGDFGLAKVQGDNQKSLTTTGHGLMGTPGYMSPEQAGGERKRIDARSDVYGLGATLYHLITGSVPFDGDSLANVVVAVLQRPPVKPSVRRPGLSAAIESIALKCLEKEPADRYPSMSDLADDLERYLAAKSVAARPPSAVTKASRWANQNQTVTLAALGGVALLALAGLGGWRVIVVAKNEAEQQRLAKLEADARREQLEREKAAAEEQARRERQQREASEAEAARREREARERERQAALTPTPPPPTASTSPPPTPTTPTPELPAPTPPTPTPPAPTPPAPAPPAPTPPAPTPPAPTPPAPTAAPPPWSGFTPPPASRRPHEGAPRWFVERYVSPIAAGAVRHARTLEGALAEVAARRVPLVVLALGAIDRLPEAIDEQLPRIAAGAVTVICQTSRDEDDRGYDAYVERHGRGSACHLHPALSCAEHKAMRKALQSSGLPGVTLHADIFDTDKEDWRVLVFLPDARGLRLGCYFVDEKPTPHIPPEVPALRKNDLPGRLGDLLAARDARLASADLAAVAAAEQALSPAELVAALRAARALGAEDRALGAWCREVRECVKDRAKALGGWAKAQPDKDERAPRLRALLEERELQQEFDLGRPPRR